MTFLNSAPLLYTVTCPNGTRVGGFPSRDAAAHYAENGHCCLAAHLHQIDAERPHGPGFTWEDHTAVATALTVDVVELTAQHGFPFPLPPTVPALHF